jgi:hypothetical protein
MTSVLTYLWLTIVAAFIATVLAFVVAPRMAAAGWLIAFLFWGGVLLGGFALSMIHRLTGGEWGDEIAPVAEALTRAMPALPVAVLPILFHIHSLFDWTGARAGVAMYWLNVPFYAACSLGLLVALALVAVWARRKPVAVIPPAFGMMLYAFAVSVFAVDWVFALRAGTMFTAFAGSLAVQQLATSLALAVLLLPDLPPRLRDDVAGLLIAMIMGALYLGFMDFLVVWYGDKPDAALWYLTRLGWPWRGVLWLAFVLGGAIPLAALIAGRTRIFPTALKPVAASLLAGAALYDAWLVGPQFGPGVIVPALAALVLMAALVLNCTPLRLAPRQGRSGHG